MFKLAPSVLAADFARLGDEVAAIEKAGAHLVHIDVMDGHFVPNISFGACVMKSLCGITGLPFDVHLMIENPEQYIGEFVTHETAQITVHQEACIHLHRTIRLIKSYGIKAGAAINPGTPPGALDCVLDDLDVVMVMSVNPGFAGQEFIPKSIEKIRYFNEARKSRKLGFEIEVDGGLLPGHVQILKSSGADILVAGSAAFANGRVDSNIKAFLGR